MTLPTDRTITTKTYEYLTDKKARHLFSQQRCINSPLLDNSKNYETLRTSSQYKRYNTDRSYENNQTARKIHNKILDTYKEQ